MAEVLLETDTYDVHIDPPQTLDVEVGDPMDKGSVITITKNGKHVVSGYDLAEVDVQPLPPQTKEVMITENGTTDVTPDEGRLLDKVVVKADTTKTNLAEFINNGGTLAAYKGTEMPEIDWDRVTIANIDTFFVYTRIKNIKATFLYAIQATSTFFECNYSNSFDIEIPNVISCYSILGSNNKDNITRVVLRRFGEVNSTIAGSVHLNKFKNLTHNSLIEFFENLGRRSGEYSQPPIQLGEANYNKLTEDEIKIATDKGWTVTK